MLYPVVRSLVRPPVRGGVRKARAGGNSGPPSANRVAWFRRGIGITSAANAVSAWADQSGLAHHLLQATGANQPTLQGDGTIITDGVSDFMQAIFTLNQPVTTYVRAKIIALPAANTYLCDGSVNGGATVLTDTSGTGAANAYAGVNLPVPGGLPIGSWFTFTFVANGASSVTQAAGAEGAGNAGTFNPGGLTIGSSNAGTFPINAQYAEIIQYAAAHDAATRAQVRAYLSTL